MSSNEGNWLDRARQRREEEEKKKTNPTTSNEGDWLNRARQRRKEEDVRNVDSDYINMFVDATDTFFSNAEANYNKEGWGNTSAYYRGQQDSWEDLNYRRNIIQEWMDSNKDRLDEDAYKSLSEITNYFDTNSTSLKNSYDAYQSKALSGLKSFEAQKVAEKNKKDERSWFDDVLASFAKTGDTTLPAGTMTNVTAAYRDDTSYREPSDLWTEGQRREFGYRYAEDPNKAYAYAEQLNRYYLDIAEGKAQADAAANASQNGWSGALNTAGAIASAPFGIGLADYLDNLAQASARGTIMNDGSLSPNEYFNAATSGIATKLNDTYGTIDEDAWMFGGKGVGDLYSLGVSGAQSIASSLAFGGPAKMAGKAMGLTGKELAKYAASEAIVPTMVQYFGMSAASSVDDALSRGATTEQALAYGSIMGAMEAAAEAFSVDNLIKIGSASTFKNFIRSAANQGLGELQEEGITSGVDAFVDHWIMADKSKFSEYVNRFNGDKKKALLYMAGDVAFDALGGFATGFGNAVVTGGVNTGMDARRGNTENIDALNQYGERTDDLIQEGLQNDKKSESYKLAEKYQQQVQGKDGKQGKAMTGFQIRNLLAANHEQITAKDMEKIQQAAERRLVVLGQREDLAKTAKIVTKYVTGGKLTGAEKRFITSSELGMQVASEALPKNIIAGDDSSIGSDKLLSKWENDISQGYAENYSTEWAEDIGTKNVNVAAYNKKEIDKVRSIIEQMANLEAEGPNAYKSLEERTGTEGRFGVSESGEATIRGTDEAFDLATAEVSEVGEGQITFKTTDGTEVYAGDIDFADESQSFLVSAVSEIENITPAAATAVMHDIVDTAKPLGVQLNGIDEAYTYGFNGYSVEDMKAGKFTKNLTEEQMMSAYSLGQSARKISDTSKTEGIKKMRTAAQAAVEKAAAEGKEAPKAKKLTITYNHGGGVIEDIATAGEKIGKQLNKEQRGGIEAAKILHQMGIGTDFELFTSYRSNTLKDKEGNPLEVFLDDEGNEQAAYAGVYMAADGKIRINLNAYSGTKGLTLNALSHELTHFIKTWSLEKYEAMAEFLVKSYGEHGVSMHQLVLKEQARLKRIRGKDVSYTEAYDEVVANAFNRMLEDGKVMERIAEIRQVDKSLADKIIEGIRKFIKRFTDVYRKNQSLFQETEALMEMKEVFEQLQEMFAEALVDASDNFQASLIAKDAGLEVMPVEASTQYSYQSLAEAAGFNAVQNDDGTRSFVRDGKKVSEVTIADIENSPIGAFINFSLEMGDISDADAKRQKKMFAEICTMACKTNDFAMTMQFVGSAVFTGMKANADKQYGTTYDFPSICTKTQAVIDAMSAKMMSLGRGLTTDEIVNLYDDVFASGNPVPCPECYVFSRWIGIGGLLDNIKKYQDYYGNMAVEDVAAEYRKMKAEVAKFAEEQGISFGKAKGALTAKLTKEFNKLTEKVEKAQNQGEKVKPADLKRLEELEPMMNTVKGMTWLESVYFADSSLKRVNPNFRVPNEVLFDLNNGEAFATKYKEAWSFRTTQGAGYGKAITPYAEARLGEGVLVTNNTTNAIKGRAQGTLNNYFLNQKGKLDKQSRDALKKARVKQKTQAFIGGQRFQSTSDARYENASDYLLAALEMQAMAGMVQCYTKVDGAVPAFAAWGFSINQSLMPLNGGLDANGNVKDTAVGGMKPSVAFDNRDKHETAGTITIGVNDNHIREMFKQWVRDFIIPYHASGGKATVVAEFRRIQEGKEAKGEAVRSTDYSRTQSDKVLSDEVLRWQGKTDAQIQRIHEIRNARIAILTGGKPNMTVVRSNRFLSALYDKLHGGEWDGVKLAKSKVESQIFPNEFWDQAVSYEDSAKITKDYLEYCEDLGFLHRFSGVVPSNGRLVSVNGYDQNGNRVQLTDLAYKYDEQGNKTNEVEPFFWKVLTDRRMYDNNGNYLPQKVVALNDTTADTVAGFAKHNQGRQYDKAKAEELANKILKGEQYSSQETDFDYSGLNWAEDLGIITGKDIAIFERTINNEIYRGAKPQSKNGEYIIDTGRCLMFTDGDFHSPTLSRVIEFATEYESLTDDAKRRIIDEAEATGEVHQSIQAIEIIFGQGFVSSHIPPAGYTHAGQNRRRKGSNGKRTNQKARSLKERFAEEGLSHLLEYSSQETDLDNAPTFYSKMGKVVEGMKQEKFGASSVISMLRGRGVKIEEIRWSGIQAFLEGKKSVTKAELLDFIKGSMLHIEEKVLGETIHYTEEQQERLNELERESTVLWDEIYELWVELISPDFTELFTVRNPRNFIVRRVNNRNLGGTDKGKRLIRLADALEQNDIMVEVVVDNAKMENPVAKWSEYKLDGGENYRELVFKMPGSTYTNHAMKGHWGLDAQGVLAHARMQDFKVDGNKMLFIEEIQSDWHNAGHKNGYGDLEAEKARIDAEYGERLDALAKWQDKLDEYNLRTNEYGEYIEDYDDVYDAYMSASARVEDSERRIRDMERGYHSIAQDAPFKDNYHEYVLKRLIRMAAEEGYDSIGWTTAQIQSDRWSDDYAEGYRIEYDQDIPKFLKKYGKQWGATVGKTNVGAYVYDIPAETEAPVEMDDDMWLLREDMRIEEPGTEVWSMDITDAMKKSVLEVGQELYSTQETDNITNRHLLANAFEGIVQDSVEYKMIQDYKSRIKDLNELEAKLSDLNSEIRKIRFGRGEYDAEKLRQLEDEAKKTAKEINRYDKRLLNMEASEPLRKVIDRERKKEAQKTKDHVKQIQENKKVRAEQAELRHKIRKTIRDLDKILKHGNKQKNVKQDMKGFVSKVLDLADYLFTDHISNDELIRRGIDAELIRGEREAQLVRETEEILTKLYDEADSLTDEEFTRLDAKRKSNEEKLKDLLTAQRNKRLSTPVYQLFDDLVNEYAKLENSSQDAVKAAYNVDLLDALRGLMGDDDQKAALKNMRVADMTTKELEALLKAYKMVLVNVRDANKIHAKVSAMTIGQMADRITNDFGSRKIPNKQLAIAAQKIANKIGWSYEKLYYALDRIGSDAFTELFMTLADSENIVMQDIMEAEAFRDDVIKKRGYNDWAVNTEIDREFLDNTGKKFKLTLAQVMALYAYTRREGAWDHLEYGGFVFGKAALTNPKPADSYKLTKEQCEAITSLLTKEQKAFAEEMQKYLSETMGAKGNEVSMKLHGIEMFGEKNYFPIHVAGQYMARAQESQAKAAAGFQTMSNAGFTHAQNRKAKAPIVLEGFMEVWTDHVNEMSRYHGTVPALEDIRRVMNRTTYSDSASESTSIKQQMINAYGEEAAQYFDNLYREANSGAITDRLQKTSKKLLSLFRKNSVAYSLSVLIQQPASLTRAYAMIDRKYFGVAPIASGVTKAVTSKWSKAYSTAYNEMLKYAPGVTMAKEIGGFDTATGGSIGSHLMDTGKSLKQKWKTGTALEKGKAALGVVDDNIIANLPNVADKIAWIEIWNACKREAVAKHKDLKPGSDAFLAAVGERFTEVIRATQVYDSIFAKSPMLKSKSLAVQYLVNFANEPNTVANMVEKAVRDVAKGDWKQGTRAAVVLVNSIVFTNLLKSMVYAMRDDDEDENYIEKYIEAVVGNLMSDFNPLSYLPIGRDVLSLAQGYDVERPDMAILADVIEAYRKRTELNDVDTEDMTEEKLIELEKKVTEANWKLAESVASFFGIPVKNIRRDVMGIINTVTADVQKSTGMSIRDTVYDALNGGKSKQDKLYAAIVDGDQTYLGRLKAGYKTDDSYNSAVRKALRENDPRIREAAVAWNANDLDEYMRIAKKIIAEKHFSQDNVVMAIRAEADKLAPDETSTTTSKAKGLFTAEKFAEAIAQGDQAMANAVKSDIIATAKKNGKTADEAENSFNSSAKGDLKELYLDGKITDSKALNALVTYCGMEQDEAEEAVGEWAFEDEYGFTFSDRGDAYKSGKISAYELKEILMDVSGKTEEEADLQIQAYDWEKEGHEGVTAAAVREYNEHCDAANVPKDVYLYLRKFKNGTTNTVDEKTGKEINYSAIRKVLAEIHAQPNLTPAQKTAIAFSLGYAERSIRKYKQW